jgi:hypothetical protein
MPRDDMGDPGPRVHGPETLGPMEPKRLGTLPCTMTDRKCKVSTTQTFAPPRLPLCSPETSRPPALRIYASAAPTKRHRVDTLAGAIIMVCRRLVAPTTNRC